MKSHRMSRRSADEMSQCRCSLISVNSHGLSRAPLRGGQQSVPASTNRSPALPAALTQPPSPRAPALDPEQLQTFPALLPRSCDPRHLSVPVPAELPLGTNNQAKAPAARTKLPHACSPAGLAYRAIMTPATPVCMAWLASSYDKMSPFPEGQRLGSQGAARGQERQLLGPVRQPWVPWWDWGWGGMGLRLGVSPAVWPLMAGWVGRSELKGRGPTEQGHGAGRRHALRDVPPVGQLGVALLPGVAVELEGGRPHREGGRRDARESEDQIQRQGPQGPRETG